MTAFSICYIMKIKVQETQKGDITGDYAENTTY